jgi:hypothetical protein
MKVGLCRGGIVGLRCVGFVSVISVSEHSEGISEESRNMLVYVGVLYVGLRRVWFWVSW